MFTRLSKETHEELQRIAVDERRSLSMMVRILVEEALRTRKMAKITSR